MAVMSQRPDTTVSGYRSRMPAFAWMTVALLLIGVPAHAEPVDAIEQALDAFHNAAARADFNAYSDLMTREVVFLGTDATERWQGDAFRAFARPYFDEGKGWTYLPQERRVDLMPGGETALFDELLSHARLGTCRGSGVMILEGTQWKVAQYNLSVPIPNALVEGVAQQIVALEQGPPAEADTSADAAQIEEDVAETSQPKSGECRRKRHKTNTKAGC